MKQKRRRRRKCLKKERKQERKEGKWNELQGSALKLIAKQKMINGEIEKSVFCAFFVGLSISKKKEKEKKARKIYEKEGKS